MEWLVINLVAMGWMLFNARGRGVKNLYLLSGLTVFFGAWLIPHYIAVRPLFKGERREGGYWWNFFKNFILVWTIICVVWWIAGMGLTSQAINESSDKWERAGAGLGAAIGTGMIFFCWIAASMVSVVLGFLLKNSNIEEGDIDRAEAHKSVKEITREAGNAIDRVNVEIQNKSSELQNRPRLVACVNDKCSARLPLGARFCKECGVPQTAGRSNDELERIEISSKPKSVAPPAVAQKSSVPNTPAAAPVNRAETTAVRNKQAVPSANPVAPKSSKKTIWVISAICLISGLVLAGVGYWGWQQKLKAEERAQALLLQKEEEQQRKEAEEKRLAEEQQRLQRETEAKQAEQEAADNAAQEEKADRELSAHSEQAQPVIRNEMQSQTERVRPSFDCAKATKNYELLVCRNDELARLDNDLTKAYARRMSETRDEVAQYALKEQQRGWLRDARNVCADESCLKGAYISRINRLQQSNP